MMPAHPRSTLFPYTTLFRSIECINSRSLGAPGSSCAGAEKCRVSRFGLRRACFFAFRRMSKSRSEEHTSELQSHSDLVCRLLLEKKRSEQPRTITLTAACHA